ncbi:MAG TPA: molybdopterin-synthase adenylyltransferase MoeB [Gallionellaceae bacterium]|nr:molybdopterin-synthase adenylyltransferase MoeB [Gallionellaceae bacterium]
MNDQQLLRYSRHILLPEIGVEGQDKWLASRALIIGAGGLGSPAAMYLAASGIGQLAICDHDTVDLTNLQRQLLHRDTAVGQPKVVSAQQTLSGINPDVAVIPLQARADARLLAEQVARADVVLDCSDNFDTRYAVNRACLEAGVPLVSGAATRFEGQLCVFDFRRPDSPCYNCLYPEKHESEETRCAIMGVFAPLVGVIGALQAAEALKLLAGAGETLSGKLLLLDALTMGVRTARLARDPGCAVCKVQ